MNKFIKMVEFLTVAHCFMACSTLYSDQLQTDNIGTISILTPIEIKNSTSTDSVVKDNSELANIYSLAIKEFINVCYKKNHFKFDTLFFGKHKFGQPDDFPNIELPTLIENTQIRLITPEEGKIKLAESRYLVYINLMGWVDKSKAEFLFIVFINGAVHQFDYYINFLLNLSTSQFELDNIEFENYSNISSHPIKRILVYRNGKYFLD